MKKIILIIIILFFIVIFTFTQSFATYYDDLTNYKVDPIQYLTLWQDNLQASAFSTLLRFIGDTSIDELSSPFKELVNKLMSSSSSHYPYVVYQNNTFFVYNYTTVYDSYEGTINISINNNADVSVPTILHRFTSDSGFFISPTVYSFKASNSNTIQEVSFNDVETDIPDCLVFRISPALQNFRDTLNNQSTSAIAEAINKNNEIQQETNEKLQEQNDFLQEDISEDEINSTLPSMDSSTDITSSGVDSIFSAITNGINNDDPIEVTLLGETFTISKDLLSSNIPSVLVSILNLFWWFFISYRIFKDIINIFEKVTTGEIDKIDTTNVKADLF